MVVAELTKKSWRVCKEVTKGYSKTQHKARNATKNDPSLPTTQELNELADMSLNEMDFIEIMETLDKRLNDKGRLWRHVFKALVVLEYLLLWGSDNVIRYCQDNLYEIKTLREFQYIDDNGTDCGANVRQKAKDVTNLVLNPTALQLKRQRAGLRNGHGYNHRSSGELDDPDPAPRVRASRSRGTRDNDAEMQRALEESRRSAEQRRATSEDEDLRRAIQLSKEDEERRRQAASSAEMSLLDADNSSKEAPLIDLSDVQPVLSNPLQVQYTQYQPVQPQYTIQPQFTQLQPQFTQFSAPYSFSSPYPQQTQSDAMQAEYMRQQLQAEWSQQQQVAQQQEMWRQQQMSQMQQQPAKMQQTQQSQSPPPIQPQPTSLGSNNPFASAVSPSPSLSSTATSSSRMSPATPFSTRSLSRTSDAKHAQLAGIFANREDDGVDTFGNFGMLRYGPTDTGRIAAQRTGVSPDHNPFHQQRARSAF